MIPLLMRAPLTGVVCSAMADAGKRNGGVERAVSATPPCRSSRRETPTLSRLSWLTHRSFGGTGGLAPPVVRALKSQARCGATKPGGEGTSIGPKYRQHQGTIGHGPQAAHP